MVFCVDVTGWNQEVYPAKPIRICNTMYTVERFILHNILCNVAIHLGLGGPIKASHVPL